MDGWTILIAAHATGASLALVLGTVMVVRRNHSRLIRPLTFRAQHGSRHRAPDGEQQGQQDQDEGTESFHVGGLSSR